MRFLSFGLLLFSLAGCNYMHSKVSTEGVTDDSLSFAWVSANIFKPSCVTCHGGATPSDGIDLSTYEGLLASKMMIPFNSDGSVLVQDVKSGRMPKGKSPVAADLQTKLARWVAIGAPETPGSVVVPPPPPPAPTPTYTYIAKYIIQPYCLHCHNSGTAAKPQSPKGGVDLSSIDSMVNSDDTTGIIVPQDSDSSKLAQVLELKKMPPQKPFPLTAAQVKAVTDWIDNWVNNGDT